VLPTEAEVPPVPPFAAAKPYEVLPPVFPDAAALPPVPAAPTVTVDVVGNVPKVIPPPPPPPPDAVEVFTPELLVLGCPPAPPPPPPTRTAYTKLTPEAYVTPLVVVLYVVAALDGCTAVNDAPLAAGNIDRPITKSPLR
jgi:hypothetical protein